MIQVLAAIVTTTIGPLASNPRYEGAEMSEEKKFCSAYLREQGLAYPRTCIVCGLGRCKREVASPPREYKLTATDYAIVRHFILDKGDVTRWVSWGKLEPLFRKAHPELTAALEQLTIAERTLKAVVNALPDEPI